MVKLNEALYTGLQFGLLFFLRIIQTFESRWLLSRIIYVHSDKYTCTPNAEEKHTWLLTLCAKIPLTVNMQSGLKSNAHVSHTFLNTLQCGKTLSMFTVWGFHTFDSFLKRHSVHSIVFLFHSS